MSDAVCKICAVVFDLGETLVNFGKVSVTGLFRRGAKLSYEYLRNLRQPVGSFRSYYWRNMFAIRFRYVLANITGNDFNSLELLKKINGGKGVSLDGQQWEQLAWLWYEPLSKMARIEPDILKTLSVLKGMGLNLAILSNTFIPASSLDRHLRQLGLLDFFSVRLYSYQFDYKKPDTRIFKAAADRVALPPQNILFVGDRINKDIKPALATGMHAVLKKAYTNIGRKIPEGAGVIEAITELPALIEKLNASQPANCAMSGPTDLCTKQDSV